MVLRALTRLGGRPGEGMFEQKIRVGMGHIGCDRLLKLGAAMDILQNASWFQMDTEKDILGYFAQNNVNMYLVSRQVDIARLPAYGEELTLRAWIYGCDRRFGFRNTAMLDERGELCMISSAMGAFISLETGCGVKIEQEAVDMLAAEPPYPMELLPRKIALPDAPAEEFEPVRVALHHLDNFQHMNNARYVDIASSCLPPGFAARRLRVEYKRAALLGQLLRPRLYRTPERLVLSLEGPEAVCCLLEFTA